MSVESECSVDGPNVVSLQLESLDARVQRDWQHLAQDWIISDVRHGLISVVMFLDMLCYGT